MTLLYDRQIIVEVAGLTVRELAIAFDVNRQVDGSQKDSQVTIFNLSPENEERIYKRPDKVRLQAGYPDTVAIIYEGPIERVKRARKDLSRQTIIKLGDSVHAADRLGGVISTSWAGPVNIRQLVGYIVRAIVLSRDPTPAGIRASLPLGPLDAIPADATYTDWVWSGPAAPALTALLRRVQCVWFEEDGIIRINKVGQPQADAPDITVSPSTGMIDRPIETDEGAECYMLLNPAVKLGCRIRLESQTITGNYKTVALKHSGDNWKGRFTTWVELRRL